jgi:enoyl-CoA hydratase
MTIVGSDEPTMFDLKIQNNVAVVTIRHGRGNTLDIELCDALAKCFDDLRTADARAVLITGQSRIFCAGVDLKRVTTEGIDYVRRFIPALHRLSEAVFFHPKPVVAAINGYTIAGGCVLACCADRRIMARARGRIGVIELVVGVPFPALALEVIRYAVPSRHFHEVTFSGATYDSAAALERGLVDEVVEADALMEHALGVAQKMALLPPLAFAHTKNQMRLPVAERMARSGAEIDKRVAEIWSDPETLKGVRDFVGRS